MRGAYDRAATPLGIVFDASPRRTVHAHLFRLAEYGIALIGSEVLRDALLAKKLADGISFEPVT